MTEAQRRLDLLAVPASDDVLRSAVEHAERVHLPPGVTSEFATQFRAAAEDMLRFGTMTADVRKAWQNLTRRISDDQVSAALASLDDALAIGACSGSEVSAASFQFSDGSYLILVDHGLANLTWLIAQLYAVSRTRPILDIASPEYPMDSASAARVLRLAASWLASGGRPGVCPPLVLSPEEITAAGVLVSEMDVFVLGHELSHILLQHFEGRRPQMGIVGGSNHLLGKRQDEEHAADRLAIQLMFDDVLHDGTASPDVVELRLTAVRLFMAAIDVFERSSFLVQPASHPPSPARWEFLYDQVLSRWFEDFDETPLTVARDLLDALAAIEESPRVADFDVVNGLGARLDYHLWKPAEWEKAAELSHLLNATNRQALLVLEAWRGWPPGADVPDAIQRLVKHLIDQPSSKAILRAASEGSRAVSRLEAMQVLTAAVTADNFNSAENQPFPSWAIAILAMNALRSIAD